MEHWTGALALRALGAALTALALSLALGGRVIRVLRRLQPGQPVREYVPEGHQKKTGTPAMGGVLMLGAVLAASLLWGRWDSRLLWLGLGALAGFGAIGFVDDYFKLVLKNSRGLAARYKYCWQSVLAAALAGGLYAMARTPAETGLFLPFYGQTGIQMGLLFVPWAYFVIVGASNAVNLTDGLDGLAAGAVILVAGGLGVFAALGGSPLSGSTEWAGRLGVPFIPGGGELMVLCAAIVGAGLGFLWFNAYPARVFMGDVGALGLGAALGAIAVMLRQELTLALMGGVFVAETLSVILQVASFKLRGKRIFRMAPIHHHFELKGCPEPRIVVRGWILTAILVMCGLASLVVH